MIIFTDNLNILTDYRIYNNCVIYNLSSPYSFINGFNIIDATPLFTVPISKYNASQWSEVQPFNQFITSEWFDNYYHSCIISEANTLCTLVLQMMIHTLNGVNVVILVQRDDFRDLFLESLQKYIQIRYGYNTFIISSLEDIDYIKDTGFTPAGIMALDADKFAYDLSGNRLTSLEDE